MTMLHNFFDSFKNKATKKSPAVDMEQKSQISAPKIIYQECLITPENIDLYRSGEKEFINGSHIAGADYITIYRYALDPNLNLSKDDIVYKNIIFSQQQENSSKLHEIKHWENDKFGDKFTLATNYYELTALSAIDEVSAYAAGCLTAKHKPTLIELYAAVYIGAETVLQTKYVDLHTLRVTHQIATKYFGQNLDVIKKHLEENIKPTYSKTFYEIGSKYLTFNGQRLFYKDAPAPQIVKQKMHELRKKYEIETQKILQFYLNILNNDSQTEH